MENNNMQKITETLGDAVKLAANLSEVTKKEPKIQHDDSNTNLSNPNQTVQIQISDPGKNTIQQKPSHIYHKPETHIHKEFPDNRALTDKECDLALEKAKMENDLKIKQMEYDAMCAEQNRRDRLAREAQDRKEREEKRIKNEKRQKIRAIIGGIVGVVTAALIGYGIYSDNRNQRNLVQNQTSSTTPPVIPGEGKVD